MKKLLAALLLTAAAEAVPVVTNGGFETGNFSGWELSNPVGTGATVVANQGGDGFSGSFHGLITLSGNSPLNVTSAAALDTFLGLPIGCLEDDDIVFGTAIRQVVTVNDLQDLSFLYNFLTHLSTDGFTLGTLAFLTIGDGTNGNNFFLGNPFFDADPLGIPVPRDGFSLTYNIVGDTESLGPLGMIDNGPITIGLVLASTGATLPGAGLAFDDILITPEADAPEVNGWQGLPFVFTLLLLCERRRGGPRLHWPT